MNRIQITVILLIISLATTHAQSRQVEQWDRFELTLKGPKEGNPFTGVSLSAVFSKGNKKMTVDGFYDGDGTYKIRFMPDETGDWTYVTRSNAKTLAAQSGTFRCVAPSANNHGPVKLKGTYHFAYADGKPYCPFGTTAYAWNHQGEAMEKLTLQTLASAPFNKIRMCVFPKRYNHSQNEPEYYPFEKIAGQKPKDTNQIAVWDFTRFNPEFFRHLETRVDDLLQLGIEADLILFHPYDKGHWGFDRMTRETDKRYLRYVQARLAAYRNVWWSLANEYDYMREKKAQDWDTILHAVTANDPYKRLCSAHNGDFYFEAWKPGLTHASIQNSSLVEDFGRAITLRDAYQKPVIYDEVCYEGNIPERWGNISAEEMVHRFWQGVLAGTYVTHGETYLNPGDTLWWAKGGRLHGQSPPRIAFLRKLIDSTGTFELIDKWKNNQTSSSVNGDILVYFGNEPVTEWEFILPVKSKLADGSRLKAEIIDTWNMTVTPVNDLFVTKAVGKYQVGEANSKKIKLPSKPYQAIRLRKV